MEESGDILDWYAFLFFLIKKKKKHFWVLLEPLKGRYYGGKSTIFLQKVHNLVLILPFYPEYNSVSTIRIRLQKVIKCFGLENILNWKFEYYSLSCIRGKTVTVLAKMWPSSQFRLAMVDLSIYHLKLCSLFSKRPRTISVIRKNQLSSFYYLCGIAYFYVARKWF
jgi:hypothetical protein